MASRYLSEKYCPLCSFVGPSVGILLGHLRTVHSSDPRFNVTCGLDGCTTTSKSFSALYSHIYRKHPNMIARRYTNGSTSIATELVVEYDSTQGFSSEIDSSELSGEY